MNRYTLHEIFVVHQYSIEKWEVDPQENRYFEIIFIEFGEGYLHINGAKHPYTGYDIFLIGSEDDYEFEIEQHSGFSHFKFTDLLFSSKNSLADRKLWLQRIEQLLHHPNSNSSDVIVHEEDRKTIWDIFTIIMVEFKNEKIYYQEIISNAISTILSVIVRNISDKHDTTNKRLAINSSRIEQILGHIRQNVYDNDLTKISYMANKFNMSQSSISSYFKKTTGESIHQYVTKYKMKLVEYRLMHTEFTIAEIAYQLGYTDESHLTKTFKKHYSMSPKQYRKDVVVNQ